MGFGPVRGRISSEESGGKNDGGGGESLVSFPFLSFFPFLSSSWELLRWGGRVMLGVGWWLG